MTDRRAPDRIRLVYGATLMLAPRRALQIGGAREREGPAVAVVRVLGARHVAQSLLLEDRPRLAGSIDMLHAASMLLLARANPHYHRAAKASAAVSAGFALATVAAGRQCA